MVSYKFEVEMMLSPAWASVAMAMNCAACPDAVASAAAPPSSAAIRFSKTATVGYTDIVVDVSNERQTRECTLKGICTCGCRIDDGFSDRMQLTFPIRL